MTYSPEVNRHNNAKICFNGSPWALHGLLGLSGIPLVNHPMICPVDKGWAEFTKARDYLLHQDTPKDIVDTLFDKKGKLLLKNFQVDIDPTQLNLIDLEKLLKNKLTPIYEAINYSLNGSTKDGFNQHDIEHVSRVSNQACRFLEAAGYDGKCLKRAVIAAYCHDLGNLLSRKSHEIISANLTELIFPELVKDTEQWKIIKDAILFHNEPMLAETFAREGIREPSDQIDYLKKYLPPEALAVLMADKIQVGRERITNKEIETNVLDQDQHLELNLMVNTTSTEITDSSFVWNLDFNRYILKNESPKVRRFVKRKSLDEGEEERFKVHVSETVHRLHRSKSIPYHYTYASMFFDLYFDRNFLTMASVFALFENVQEFSICIHDKYDSSGGKGSIISETVFKEGLNEQLVELEKKYQGKTKRKRNRWTKSSENRKI